MVTLWGPPEKDMRMEIVRQKWVYSMYPASLSTKKPTPCWFLLSSVPELVTFVAVSPKPGHLLSASPTILDRSSSRVSSFTSQQWCNVQKLHLPTKSWQLQILGFVSRLTEFIQCCDIILLLQLSTKRLTRDHSFILLLVLSDDQGAKQGFLKSDGYSNYSTTGQQKPYKHQITPPSFLHIA